MPIQTHQQTIARCEQTLHVTPQTMDVKRQRPLLQHALPPHFQQICDESPQPPNLNGLVIGEATLPEPENITPWHTETLPKWRM
jgi:hypothetical protein